MPARDVQDHIDGLLALGMTIPMISRAAGITATGLRRIAAGEWEHVRYRTAGAILDVDHVPHPRQSRCLAIGARRRVNALVAAGWPMEKIAGRAGTSLDSLRNFLRRSIIDYSSWSAINRVYEELSGAMGPSRNAATKARSLGFQLPMEWEGYDIDDPRVTPPKARRRSQEPRGGLDAGERRDRRAEVARLTAAGLSSDEIATRLGIDPRTVVRDRSVA
ncbi:helix-turn-helix domain-containing protein [Rhodococcus sp. NPDC127527]